MKKIIVLLLICVMGLSFTACSKFEKKIQYLGVVTLDGYKYIDEQQLKAENEEYITEFIAGNENDISENLFAFIEKKPFAVIVIGDVNQKTVIEALKENNIPVLFIGSAPNNEALDSYDKAWCLTANENQGGEMLGFEIGSGFKSHAIEDQNGDDILQCAMVYKNKTSLFKSIIQSAEDLGVYSEAVDIEITDIAMINDIILEKYNSAIAPELIICENEELALAVQLAFSNINQPINVTFVHKDYSPLSITSPPLFKAVQYPYSEITSACKQFINNILIKETVNHDTDIRLNSHKTSVFSYTLTN